MRFNEGKIADFIVEGNTITNPTIIIREISKVENGFYRLSDIQESIKNLRSTNLFEDVNIYSRKSGLQNFLVVRVIEKKFKPHALWL